MDQRLSIPSNEVANKFVRLISRVRSNFLFLSFFESVGLCSGICDYSNVLVCLRMYDVLYMLVYFKF